MADEHYFICGSCGAYLKNPSYYISSQQEKNHYEEHNNDVDDIRYQNFTSPITNLIFENHTQEQLGLDFGCGTGPVISKQLMEKGFRVKLFDPYFYPDQDYLEHHYDFIFSCEVFEHFYHPKKEIEKLLNILRPGGRLYIMTHLFQHETDFANWHYRRDPTHVFIYTVKTIEFIANRYNLTIENIAGRLIVLIKNRH